MYRNILHIPFFESVLRSLPRNNPEHGNKVQHVILWSFQTPQKIGTPVK